MDWTLNWSVAVSAIALLVGVWSAWFATRRKQAASVELQGLAELEKAAVEGRRIAARVNSITRLEELKQTADKKGKEGVLHTLEEFSKLVNEIGFLYEKIAHYLQPQARSLLDDKKEYIRRYLQDEDESITFEEAMRAIFMFPQQVLEAIEKERDDIVGRNR